MENRLVIAGIVARAPESRRTPAGITIGRFPLRHRSTRPQAGMEREVVCNLWVKASGELCRILGTIEVDDSVRVSGYLARADSRHGNHRLVLHAESIEKLAE